MNYLLITVNKEKCEFMDIKKIFREVCTHESHVCDNCILNIFNSAITCFGKLKKIK